MKIVVYGSKPAWGTPDLSPFVIKLETWLRLAGLPYERRDGGNPMQAPRGKIPYLEIDGERLGDSQVIIEELQIANCHLRKMVDSLFLELNNCQRENNQLKQRVRNLVSWGFNITFFHQLI